MNTASSQVPHLATTLTGPLMALEKHFLEHQTSIEGWFREQWAQQRPPFYCSVDLRNAGFKLAPVDTNLFPAGFNNLNPDFNPLCTQATQAIVAEICPDISQLLLIPESHTRNPFYFESLFRLYTILTQSGFETRIGSIDPECRDPLHISLASGDSLIIEPTQRINNRITVGDFSPCAIILNNDLSSGVPSILDGIEQKVMPAIKLAWSSRLKSNHFSFYNSVTAEFCEKIDIDPWLLTPYFDQCPEVNFMEKAGQQCLASRADQLFKKIKKKYSEYNIDQEPFLVVKSDQGTYGMAVMMIRSPQELEHLNRKQRTKMSVNKGGVAVTKAIIQEGIFSFETVENNAVAEPVVYMIGRHVVGGFYRVHNDRGPTENLNAPGMNFKPLAFSESANSSCAQEKESINRFYAYGVVARLALVAAARELAAFSTPRS